MRSAAAVVSALVLLAFATPALAERYVVVNNQRLSDPQIAQLEQLRCAPIPNGRYWLDPRSGIWGYANNPQPQGYIGDPCSQATRRPSLSERGMLFSPRDWVR